MRHTIIVYGLFLLLPLAAAAQEHTTDKLERRWQDYLESEQGQEALGRQAKSNAEFMDMAMRLAKAFTTNYEKVNAIKQENFRTVANMLLPDLYNRRTTDPESKYLLAELVLYEPRLLGYVDKLDYSVQQANADLQELAITTKHPGAQFSVGKRNFDWRSSELPGTKMVKEAAAQYHFEALIMAGTDETPAALSTEYLDLLQSKKPEQYEQLLIMLLNTYDYESFMYLTGYDNAFKTFVQKKQRTLKKSDYPEISKAYLKTFGQLQAQTWNNKYKAYYVDKKAVDEFAKAVQQADSTDSMAGKRWKVLGDMHAEYYWLQKDASHYVFFGKNDLTMAQTCYQKAYELGNMEAQYKYACLLSENLRILRRDIPKATELLLDLEKRQYKPACWKLAEQYEFGRGVKMDLDKANQYYEDQFKRVPTLGVLLALYRLNRSKLVPQYPIYFMADRDNILENLHASPKKVKVLHFWHQGFDTDEYVKSIRLAKEFSNSKNIHLLFASQNGNKDIGQILKAAGYRGLIFEMQSRSREFDSVRTAYRAAIFGANNPLSEKLAENFGDILPEYDARWTKQGLPATFVYVEEEKRSYYFPALIPVEEIIKFVHDKASVKPPASTAPAEKKPVKKAPKPAAKKPIQKSK
jgi:hypothetical protein